MPAPALKMQGFYRVPFAYRPKASTVLKFHLHLISILHYEVLRTGTGLSQVAWYLTHETNTSKALQSLTVLYLTSPPATQIELIKLGLYTICRQVVLTCA